MSIRKIDRQNLNKEADLYHRLSLMYTLAPSLAVSMGALTQVRVLGGTIGLAICSTVLKNHVRSRLLESSTSIITPKQLQLISGSLAVIDTFPPSQQAAIRTAFAEGYNRQMRIMTVFSGAALLTSLLIWEPKPRKTQ